MVLRNFLTQGERESSPQSLFPYPIRLPLTTREDAGSLGLTSPSTSDHFVAEVLNLTQSGNSGGAECSGGGVGCVCLRLLP